MSKSRRQFLTDMGSLAATTVLLSSYPWFSAFSQSGNTAGERANIAVIGTGSRGQYLLGILAKNPKVNIIALCDNYEPHLAQASKIAPNAKCFSNFKHVLDLKDVQAVIVATPLHQHAHIVLAAFDAGKHVFCEKSCAPTVEECLAMYRAYLKSNRVFFIGHQRMFDPRYLKTIELIRSGTIGTVEKINTFWYRNSDWRRPVPSPELEQQINWRLYRKYSGGLMTELASHQIQVGNWALNALPESVMGSGAIVHWNDGREVYDNVSVIYTYPNGIKMTFDSMNSNKFYGLEEQILGTLGTLEPEKGKFYFEDIKPAPGILQLINDIEKKVFDAIPIAGPSWAPETANENNGEYLLGKRPEHDGSELMLEAFAEAVITNQKVPELVKSGYYASVLALLGNQAMEEKQILTFPDFLKI